MRILIGVVFFLVVSFPAYTSSFQNEISLMGAKDETSSSIETNVFGVAGAHYLSPVDASNIPINEAQFINKASAIGAFYGHVKYKDSGNTYDGNMYLLGGEIVTPQDFDISIQYSKLDVSDSVSITSDNTKIELGQYYGYTHAVALVYGFGSTDLPGGSIDNKEVGIVARGFLRMVKYEISYMKSTDDDGIDEIDTNTVAGGIDYYIDNTFSVNVGFERADENISGGETLNTLMFGVSKYFTRNIYIDALYEDHSSNIGKDTSGVTISVGGKY